jgi:uncharacterized protein GlcG (DUF336 family)
MPEKLTLAHARTILDAALAKAEEIGVPSNVAIVDSGANLLTFARMDGAWLGSIEIAQNKAYTARAFDMSTKELAKISQPGDSAYGIAMSTNHKIAIFSGGIPLKAGDVVVGAIGSSGGTPSQDQEVAEAGADAYAAIVESEA